VKTKTGQCYYLDENEQLCIAISYIDENGFVTTENEIVGG
jgi:hypothetical protein